MISETPILVMDTSKESSKFELDIGTAPIEDDVGTIAEEGVGLSTLLLGGNVSEEPGTVATELLDSSTGGLTGLLSSSEQAENIPITETQVPTASHFLVFISAFLFFKFFDLIYLNLY
jgi:hypothetical protein